MTKAIFAGSFDPFTNGHLDTVERAALLFESVVVAVATNTNKKSLFSSEEKITLIEEAIKHLENVEVMNHTGGLTVDLALEVGARVMIRGVRSVKDFEYEVDIAHMNKVQAAHVETILMTSKPEYTFISSSMIKEVLQFDGNISGLVPENVEKALIEKYKN